MNGGTVALIILIIIVIIIILASTPTCKTAVQGFITKNKKPKLLPPTSFEESKKKLEAAKNQVQVRDVKATPVNYGVVDSPVVKSEVVKPQVVSPQVEAQQKQIQAQQHLAKMNQAKEEAKHKIEQARQKAQVEQQRKTQVEQQKKAQLEQQKKAQVEQQKKTQAEQQKKNQLEQQKKVQLEQQQEEEEQEEIQIQPRQIQRQIQPQIQQPKAQAKQPQTQVEEIVPIVQGSIENLFDGKLSVEAEFGLTEAQIDQMAREYHDKHLAQKKNGKTRHRSLRQAETDVAETKLRNSFMKLHSNNKRIDTEEFTSEAFRANIVASEQTKGETSRSSRTRKIVIKD